MIFKPLRAHFLFKRLVRVSSGDMIFEPLRAHFLFKRLVRVPSGSMIFVPLRAHKKFPDFSGIFVFGHLFFIKLSGILAME